MIEQFVIQKTNAKYGGGIPRLALVSEREVYGEGHSDRELATFNTRKEVHAAIRKLIENAPDGVPYRSIRMIFED